jgi:hypothetical protein
MFQSSKKRIEALLGVVDDMLVGAPDEAEIVAPHPHQRTVHLRLERRAGTVGPRAMLCLSPVRSSAPPARERVR